MRRTRRPRLDPPPSPEQVVRGWLAFAMVVLLVGVPLGIGGLGVGAFAVLPPWIGPPQASAERPTPRPPRSPLPAVAPPTLDPTSTVHDVPASIDATGARDETLALGAFLASTPDGSTIRLAEGGRYRVEGTFRILGRHDLTIDGRGATLVALDQTDDADRAHVSIEDSTGIWVHSLSVEGAHPEPGTYVAGFEWQHGFQVLGGSDIEIGPNVATSGNQGDGVYVGEWAERVTVRDCTIAWNGRMGVAVVAGRDVLVERCTLNHIAFSAFDIEPGQGATPPEGAQGITFRDNLINGPVFSKFFSIGGYGAIHDVLVADNVVDGAQNGIVVDGRPQPGTPRRTNVTIVGNVGEGVLYGSDAVMHLQVIDGLRVTGNRQAVAEGGVMFVRGQDLTDVEIADNECPGCVEPD